MPQQVPEERASVGRVNNLSSHELSPSRDIVNEGRALTCESTGRARHLCPRSVRRSCKPMRSEISHPLLWFLRISNSRQQGLYLCCFQKQINSTLSRMLEKYFWWAFLQSKAKQVISSRQILPLIVVFGVFWKQLFVFKLVHFFFPLTPTVL